MDKNSIGIDFGTTKTLVAYPSDHEHRPEIANMGRERYSLPTSAFMGEKGAWEFGDDADDYACDPYLADRYTSKFKLKLGSSSPVLQIFGEQGFDTYTALDVTAKYLEHIRCLGYCYQKGYGVKKDLKEAFKCYQRSAKNGNNQAQRALERIGRKQTTENKKKTISIDTIRKSAKAGNAEKQYYLGYCYEVGQGVERDADQPAYWYGQAAQAGHAKAQYNYGRCYENGIGVDCDNERAYHWYSAAAKQDNPDAQNRLGDWFFIGKYVKKSYSKAHTWFEKADKTERDELLMLLE